MAEQVKKQKDTSTAKVFTLSALAAVIFTQIITVFIRGFFAYLPVFARSAVFSTKGFSFFGDSIELFLSLFIFYLLIKKYYLKAFKKIKVSDIHKNYALTFFVLAKALCVIVEKLSENFCFLMLRLSTLRMIANTPQGTDLSKTINDKSLLTKFGHSFLSTVAAIVMIITLFFVFHIIFSDRKKSGLSKFLIIYAAVGLVSFIITLVHNIILGNPRECIVDGLLVLGCTAFSLLFLKRGSSKMGMKSADWERTYPLIFLGVFLVLIPFCYNLYTNFRA